MLALVSAGCQGGLRAVTGACAALPESRHARRLDPDSVTGATLRHVADCIRPRRPTLREVAQRAGVSPTTASFVLAGRDDMRISDDARQRVLRAAGRAELPAQPDGPQPADQGHPHDRAGLRHHRHRASTPGAHRSHGTLSTALDAAGTCSFVSETEGDPGGRGPADRGPAGPPGRRLHLRHHVHPAGRACRAPWPATAGAAQLPRPATPAGPRGPAGRARRRPGGGPGAAASRPRRRHLRGRRAAAGGLRRPRAAGRASRSALAAAGARLAGRAWTASGGRSRRTRRSRRLLRAGRPPPGADLPERPGRVRRVPGAAGGRVGIPDEVSVVSFDDSDLAGWLRPQLTSVALPHFELGRRAVETAADGAAGRRRRAGADAVAAAGLGRAAVPGWHAHRLTGPSCGPPAPDRHPGTDTSPTPAAAGRAARADPSSRGTHPCASSSPRPPRPRPDC